MLDSMIDHIFDCALIGGIEHPGVDVHVGIQAL